MIYSIHYFRAERELGNTPWDKGFESAKIHARAQMKAHEADRVEVRNENKALCFHFPRTVERAPNG